MSISYGYDSEYYIKLAKQHDFDVLNIEIHKLNDIMTMTLNEADYQKVLFYYVLFCAILYYAVLTSPCFRLRISAL